MYATTPVATRRATLDNDLGRLKNSTSVLNLSYEISSHRKVLGPPLVYGRRLINGEVRRYVDPSLSAQSYFNADVVRVLAELSSRGELTDQSLDHLKTSLYADMDQLVIRKVNEVAISIETDLTRMAMLSDQIRDVGAGEARSGGDTSAAPAASVDYAQFAQAIGRSWERISGKGVDHPCIFEDALGLFQGGRKVLDIGCGGGFFLCLLKDHGIGAYGIDVNDELINACREKGVEAIRAEAGEHLTSLDDDSLDGVSSAR